MPLIQANAGMSILELVEDLFPQRAATITDSTCFIESFGGSETFVFNKLENSEKPRMPVLGCGVMYALSKVYLPNEFGSGHMPSSITWVV
jgi:hypothetical protein